MGTYDPNQTKRRAIFVSLALLPVALLIVAGTTDRPLSCYMWVLATVAADWILCVLIGGVCLFVGKAVSLADRQSEAGKHLMGFGTALAMIFFTAMGALSLFYPRGRDSE